ncbi:MAG: electron transport complex subunit RsxC [Clostridia bacterium]|nr:electron transport complex subunit RsxC [Clostridia bacterium]
MRSELLFPKRPYGTHGGVKVTHCKNTAGIESVIMPPPERVEISMNQNIGDDCIPTVKVGDSVYVGQIIGDSDKFLSVPIHSSVSGVVEKINKRKDYSGRESDVIVIKSDGLMTPIDGIKPHKVDNLKELTEAVRASGLVGLGGAGFPAHVKLNVPEGKSVDTLIINCAECEPYITADHREAIENSWDVFSGIYAFKDIIGIKRVIIGVEDNKPDAIDVLKQIADNPKYDPDDMVRVLPLKASYPYGAEKVLVKACTNRVIPTGGLPVDVGCIVMNITSVSFISRYMKNGMPLVSKRITVDGSAVKEPKNVIAPIGTSIKDIVEFCGGLKSDAKKIILGGPMMGTTVSSDSEVIKKNTNAVLLFDEEESNLMRETDCIRCGKCASSCPMKLTPPIINTYMKQKDINRLEKLGVMTCMECGCCAYSCPAGKHLVQMMREAKQMIRANK